MNDVVTTDIFKKLCPFLEKFSLPEDSIRKAFDEEPDLLQTVVKIFSHGYSEDVSEWLLMPLKFYSPSFIETVADKVSDSNTIVSAEFVNAIIGIKQGMYKDYIDSSFGDFLSYDYFERISLMMADISGIRMFTGFYPRYFIDKKHEDNLAYIATDFPCAQFIESLGSKESSSYYLCHNFRLLLNLDSELFRSFVNKNISHYQANQPTFVHDDIDIIVPGIADESSIYCGDFADLLEFVLENENTKDAKLKLFPILKSFYESKKYDRKEIYSFLGRFSSAPDSFFSFLGENIDNQPTHFLLEDELRNSSDLFHFVSDISDEEKRETLYPLLIHSQYLSLSFDKRNLLHAYLKNYNKEIIQSLRDEFEDRSINFDNVDDLSNFSCLFRYLSSSSKSEFANKVKAIHAVSHQLDAKHLDRYLWYLENSNLHEGREYKAHSAYFKNHSIDKFFGSFDYDSSWKKDVLLMTTDDKKKKKQQLRLIKKCPISRLEDSTICDQVLNTVHYSHDINNIKSIVNLVINPLFNDLSCDKQLELMSPFVPKSKTVTIHDGEDQLDIVIPNLDSFLEQLPEEGFMKCKSMQKKSSACEIYVGRSKK